MGEIIPTELPHTIDLSKIQAALARPGAELGLCPEFSPVQPQLDIYVFESLPSTSTHLWNLQKNVKAGTVVVAQRQSAGRGQRGHVWHSEPGGLYLSLALEPDLPVSHSAQLTCLSAWGIATALNNLGIPVQVKWPNDLFFRGKKLGGILTETKVVGACRGNSGTKLSQAPSIDRKSQTTSGPTAHIAQAVVGVGINWHNPVPETGITLAEILETIDAGKPDSESLKNKINCLEVLIALVIRGILQGAFFRQRVGGQVFMKAYQKLLTQFGKVVSIDSDTSYLAKPDISLSLADQSSGNTDTTTHSHRERAISQGSTSEGSTSEGNTSKKKRSGKVIGISEEGYLKVALVGSSSYPQASPAEQLADCPGSPDSSSQGFDHRENIVLLRPSEIRIS
ncbi:MAG: biotin--[acetyl-CoA-carboxylase] ligase [Cyanobacteria bacterium J06627_28]